MTREGTRPLAALIAAVLVAGLLAACGSSDSSSSSSTSASTPSSGSPTTEAGAQNGAQGDSSKKGGGQKGDAGQSQSRPSGDGASSGRSVEEVETPLKVSGGGSAQFRTKGGDNSVQEFGGEGDESELQEAAEVVHGFYVARAAEEWDKACAYLAKSNIEQLEKLGSQAGESKQADCATVLKAFTQPLPPATEREVTTVDAGSLRHEGEQGFLIYFGAGHVTYAMPLKDEGGTWKVAALSGTTLG